MANLPADVSTDSHAIKSLLPGVAMVVFGVILLGAGFLGNSLLGFFILGIGSWDGLSVGDTAAVALQAAIVLLHLWAIIIGVKLYRGSLNLVRLKRQLSATLGITLAMFLVVVVNFTIQENFLVGFILVNMQFFLLTVGAILLRKVVKSRST